MKLSALFFISMLFFALCGSERKIGLRYDFNDPESLKKSWEFHCSLFMVPRTTFKIEHVASALDKKSLAVEAKSATGVLMTDPKVNLRKYPVMRWRWRVVRPVNVPPGSREPDDQAGVIYLGDGTMISQKSVAYRWECNTSPGKKKDISYGGGMMKVRAECIRNKRTAVGEWVVEERDVLADFIRAYKRFPGEYFILGVGANSQYSKSDTRLEIDYIEFVSRKKK